VSGFVVDEGVPRGSKAAEFVPVWAETDWAASGSAVTTQSNAARRCGVRDFDMGTSTNGCINVSRTAVNRALRVWCGPL
jgi:hypothetical protein